MKLLLDTHSFLWFINGDFRLSQQARTLIEDLGNQRFLSLASVWEIAIKVSIRKLSFPRPFDHFMSEWLQSNAIEMLPITVAHLAAVAELPVHHRDPFDRLLIAQAMAEDMPIIGRDALFDCYPVRRLW